MELWDELGIPHKERKQVFGPLLPIIGIDVNAWALTLTLMNEAKDKLVEELCQWCKPGRKEKIKRWYQMGGWFNWALNIYPWLRLPLNNFYPKLKGRSDSTALIWVNNTIRNDFTWAIIVLGKFGSKLFQTQFKPNPNCAVWFRFGKSWKKPNGLVSSLAILKNPKPFQTQFKPN